jgi:hypothetical protein
VDVRESPSRVGAPEYANDFLADESALNKEARIRVVATPPVGEKAFIGEESEQFVLARPDREAFANTVIKFAAELGFIARQRRDDLRKRAEARKSAGRESAVANRSANADQIARRTRSAPTPPTAREPPTR